MTQWVGTLVTMPDEEFNPWVPYGVRRKLAPESCPLTPTRALEHV